MASVEPLARQIRQAQNLLAFTGAGISTGSGIPDFRGPDGLWTRWRPVYYQEFLTSHDARVRHWEYKTAGWREFRNARPNAAHRALFELEQMGKLQALVTQNIDGLHQLAGHDDERVIELHGTNRKIHCVDCGDVSEPETVFAKFEESGQPPVCGRCGGFLKPATISFGQAMPMDRVEQAIEAALQADVVLSVGSSLEVEPAATVPRTAAENGAYYAILNRGPTAHDQLAEFRSEEDLTEFLPKLVAALRSSA